jgi:hypothetical protein
MISLNQGVANSPEEYASLQIDEDSGIWRNQYTHRNFNLSRLLN